jgi:hypothetical protein
VLRNRELGKLPPTALDGLIYSSESMGIDRGCPWMTAVDRCLGHGGGTAGEDDAAQSLAVMAPARPEGEARPQ